MSLFKYSGIVRQRPMCLKKKGRHIINGRPQTTAFVEPGKVKLCILFIIYLYIIICNLAVNVVCEIHCICAEFMRNSMNVC